MPGRHVLAIRHSSALRSIAVEEVRSALETADRAVVVTDAPVDTAQHASDTEGGYWDSSHAYLRRLAGEIRQASTRLGAIEMHYFGLAEIPHVICFGAYIGDEQHVYPHDYDRDRATWSWPIGGESLAVEIYGLPTEQVTHPGPVVVRVEISSAIADQEVDEAVGKDRLADIRIRPAGSRIPVRGIVRSDADVESVRLAFRQAMAAIADARPAADVIHLFVAAPVSVCFVIGQELHLRSGSAVQTYQHRVRESEISYRPGILLRPGDEPTVTAPLSNEEISLAAHLREVIWRRALDSVIRYAVNKREGFAATGKDWFDALLPAEVHGAAPFLGLRPIWEVVEERHGVSPEPRESDYAFDKDNSVWRLSDRLLLGLHRAARGDEARMEELVRLFLFHEYIHDWQVLTKYTAEDVGSFANCLERIDYIADTYALFHQLDFVLRHEPERLETGDLQRAFLTDQIDLAIQSFWAFEPLAPHYEWQERRLRRYMNWFWRRVQVNRAPNLATAVQTLSRQPAVEVAGLQYRTGRGRVFVVLNQRRPGHELEIGLVLEDERFLRMGSAGNMSIEAALGAFAEHKHEEIALFFNSLFENVRATGGVFPSAS